MKRLNSRLGLIVLILACSSVVALLGCSGQRGPSPQMVAKIDSMKAELAKYTGDKATMENYLAKFDTLDFVVFSNQQWVRLHESHSADVVVTWPDGHKTNGLERHIQEKIVAGRKYPAAELVHDSGGIEHLLVCHVLAVEQLLHPRTAAFDSHLDVDEPRVNQHRHFLLGHRKRTDEA